MKMKKGFTLIELLVVVLIIGILAAIALPQYQKAVEKARMAEAIIQVRALAEAEKRYFLENGQYATTFDNLDITFPGTPEPETNATVMWQNNIYLVVNAIDSGDVYAASHKNPYKDGLWYIHYDLANNKLYCAAYKTDTKSNNFCKTYRQEPITCRWNNDLENCYEI